MKRNDEIAEESVFSQQMPDDWGFILQECRHQRIHLEENNATKEEWASFMNLFTIYSTPIEKQLSNYCERLSMKKNFASGDEKELIRNTRNALRIAVSFLSIPDADSREAVQNSSISCWANSTLTILGSERGDAKCRLFAAQLLNNLVTQNEHTARTIHSLVSFAPSTSEICTSIRNMAISQGNEKNGSDNPRQDGTGHNWVDMVLCSSKSNNREALAALVAALHNMFSARVELSVNALLVSTLLRQLIAADSIKSLIQGGTSDEMTDTATEWIVLLIAMYCREGQLASLYQAAGGIDVNMKKCLPEQVVLLHCVRSIIDDPTDQANERHRKFGSEESSHSISTHIFLSDLLSALLTRTLVIASERNFIDEELSLVSSASKTILDILSETLTADSEEMQNTRIKIGQDTELISVICKALGKVYDTVTLRNSGRNARETVIYDDEQAMLVSLVRLLGNLAFGCTSNQDAIRQTKVPLPANEINTAHCLERSGLHVLLSCTAYSHACFTLREWAVVAIRNVLENNSANQDLVEHLEATQSVQSAAVNDMGIQVNLETKSGKVEILPLDKIKE